MSTATLEQAMPTAQAIQAEAAEMLSQLGDSFDSVVLTIAQHLAARRPEGKRDVTVDDVREAISLLCGRLEKRLHKDDLPDGAKSAIKSLIDLLQEFGATC
jgi:Mg-chelatase subunit ChlI